MKQKLRLHIFLVSFILCGLFKAEAQFSDNYAFSLTFNPSSPEFVLGQKTEIGVVLGNVGSQEISGVQITLNVGNDYELTNLQLGQDLEDTKYIVQPADGSRLPKNGELSFMLINTDILNNLPISGEIVKLTFDCVDNNPLQSNISFKKGSVKITGYLGSNYLEDSDDILSTSDISDSEIITPVESITITNKPTGNKINIGEEWTFGFSINPTDAMIEDVEWNITPEGIVSVSQNPQDETITVTGISEGQATLSVIVTSEKDVIGTKTDTYTFEVKRVEASAVTITHQSLTLTIGEKQKLTSTVSPSNTTDPTVIWTSDNSNVANVSEDGTVTALTPGTATITATCGSVSATCKVKVNPVMASGLTLNLQEMTLNVGRTDKLTATVTPSNTTDKTVAWKSDNEGVATVGADGTVSALSVGIAVITATCGNVGATCKVSVVKDPNENEGNGSGSGDNGDGGNGSGSGDNGNGGNGSGSGDNGNGGNGSGSGDNGNGGNGSGSGDSGNGGNGSGSGDNGNGGNGSGS
ncbi:MAG: Ig domain-containing protein, partial [Muribaculaceae bacterium]|nr:Ig domain-containing protein [Muribaculaceae bacterium]